MEVTKLKNKSEVAKVWFTQKRWVWLLLLTTSIFPITATSQEFKPYPAFFLNISQSYKVPVDVLYALAMTESNTKMRNGNWSPWPYTINLDGIGYRYSSYENLVKQSRALIKSGRRSFDVGYFQVNWKWHNHRTRSIEYLAHPYENGRVASEIMLEQYRKWGNWSKAAGRYHNPNNNRGLADKYQRKFEVNLAKVRRTMKVK